MKREREAVWNDDEDEVVNTRVQRTKVYGKKSTTVAHTEKLRGEFQSVFGAPKWAARSTEECASTDYESDFESFLASTSAANAITRFKRDDVRVRRRQDLNIDARGSCGSVSSISWQPLGQSSTDSNPLVAFSTRSDKEVRLCRVVDNGKSSSIEYSLKIQKWLAPKVIKFISTDDILITSGHRSMSRVMIYNVATEKSHFHSSIAGKELNDTRFIESNPTAGVFSVAFDGGNIVTIDKRSKQLASEVRLNNPCVGLGWSMDGTTLFAGDERSNIYMFDSRSSRCAQRTQLETTTSFSSFAINGEGLLACGSPFGTVDIVDSADCETVVTSFDKLVTAVDRLHFHPVHRTLLVAASKEKRNAVRMYECGNGRTLAGWPAEQEPIGRAIDMEFSDCGRFLAFGCKSGRVQMYAMQ